MNVGLENDRQYIILAVQTVLSLHKDSLSKDSRTIQEISEDIMRKAQMFKRISEEMVSETENQRKTWGQLLRTLSDEALLDSYYEASKLLLEKEFIALLLKEMKRRGIDVDSVRKEVNP